MFKNEMIKLQRELESPINIYAKAKEIKWRIIMQDHKSESEENLKNEQKEFVEQVSDIIDDQKKEILRLSNLLSKLNWESDIIKNTLLKSNQSN